MSRSECPCGSKLSYENCCEIYHRNRSAASPVDLMRSRYSAFALGLVEYLLDTSVIQGSMEFMRCEIQETIDRTHWVALKVLSAPPAMGDVGEVEFIAFYRQSKERALEQIHERSQFVLKNGFWLYQNGLFLPHLKLDRNGSCICGSGRKLKKCCI